MKKVIPMIALIIFGIIIFLFFLFYDIINGKEWSLYTLEIIGIMFGMILFISGSLFLVIHLNEIRIKKIQGIKILYLYLIVIIFLTGSISGLGGYLVKYFQDTDTALIEFSAHEVAETREISENIYVDLDSSGNMVSMTIEHAGEGANLREVAFERISKETA